MIRRVHYSDMLQYADSHELGRRGGAGGGVPGTTPTVRSRLSANTCTVRRPAKPPQRSSAAGTVDSRAAQLDHAHINDRQSRPAVCCASPPCGGEDDREGDERRERVAEVECEDVVLDLTMQQEHRLVVLTCQVTEECAVARRRRLGSVAARLRSRAPQAGSCARYCTRRARGRAARTSRIWRSTSACA